MRRLPVHPALATRGHEWTPDSIHAEFHITHTTFRDFLLDSEKTKAHHRREFRIHAAQAHATLALGCMRTGLYFVEKYMPQLLEEGCEVELAKLANRDLHERLQERVRSKRLDGPRHSVFALRYAYDQCA